jgi:glycosyltransferase involved in cell wall biosynthesis
VAVVTSLVVAVLTFRRLAHITELAPRLVVQAIDARLRIPSLTSVQVLVVDNDPDASARAALGNIAGIRYVHEPRPGISAARNRALDESGEADLLAFIDDDERPEHGWLAALVRTHMDTGAAAVQGAVVPRFDGEGDNFLISGGFFVRKRYPTGTVLPAAATNNLLLDLGQIRRWGLRFDDLFGLTGGEDTAFTKSIVKYGGRIVFCDEAEVVDEVPAVRMTRRFLENKAFHMGNVEMWVNVSVATSRADRVRVRLRYAVRGVVRIVAGAGKRVAGVLLHRMRWQARGTWTQGRGRGMLAAVMGNRHYAYARHDQPPRA